MTIRQAACSDDWISLPCRCATCQQMIETRHGLLILEEPGESPKGVCRACARSGRTIASKATGVVSAEARLTGTAGIDQAEGGVSSGVASSGFRTESDALITMTPSWGQSVSTGAVNAERLASYESDELMYWADRVRESLSRGIAWTDLMAGRSSWCEFRELKPLPEPQASDLKTLDAVPACSLPVLMQEFRMAGDSIPSGAFLTVMTRDLCARAEDSRPMTLVDVSTLVSDAMATAEKRADRRAMTVVMVCSFTGFDADGRAALESRLPPEWYTGTQRIVLHEISTGSTWTRPQDPLAQNFRTALRRLATGEQFRIVSEWLESQLPLSSSVSAFEVQKVLGLELDAIEGAMRFVALKHDLTIDETVKFGLILSERRNSAGFCAGESSVLRCGNTDSARQRKLNESVLQNSLHGLARRLKQLLWHR